MTARIRPPADARLLPKGIELTPRRSCFRSRQSVRQAAVYDPRTKTAHARSTPASTRITCMFAEDANNTLWFNGYGSPVPRVDQYEGLRRDAATRRSRRDGRRSSSTRTATAGATRTSRPISRSIRRRTSGIGDALYSVNPAPDGSVWGSVLGFPGAIIRVVPGPNPTETAIAERYEAAVAAIRMRRSRGTRRAAWTSIATAWPGSRSGAAIWPASIAGSATAR